MGPQPRARPACFEIAGVEKRVSELENHRDETTKQLTDIQDRLKTVEGIGSDVSSILTAIEKIGKQFRIWAPTIVGAAISAGIVNGKLGAFLHALFNGVNPG